jgi:hypothetical protein
MFSQYKALPSVHAFRLKHAWDATPAGLNHE